MMKQLIIAIPIFVIQCSLILGPPVQARPNWEKLEEQIAIEHNRVRRDPEAYIPLLETWLTQTDAQGMVWLSPTIRLQTIEGRKAIQEAIAFLKQQSRRTKLSPSKGLKKAAKSHAQYLQAGLTGHVGKNGESPQDRLSNLGRPVGLFGENISYGFQTPETVLMGLIINDGNPRRGHRNNVFEPRFRKIGVGCNQHETFGVVCVMTYATNFRR